MWSVETLYAKSQYRVRTDCVRWRYYCIVYGPCQKGLWFWIKMWNVGTVYGFCQTSHHVSVYETQWAESKTQSNLYVFGLIIEESTLNNTH